MLLHWHDGHFVVNTNPQFLNIFRESSMSRIGRCVSSKTVFDKALCYNNNVRPDSITIFKPRAWASLSDNTPRKNYQPCKIFSNANSHFLAQLMSIELNICLAGCQRPNLLPSFPMLHDNLVFNKAFVRCDVRKTERDKGKPLARTIFYELFNSLAKSLDLFLLNINTESDGKVQDSFQRTVVVDDSWISKRAVRISGFFVCFSKYDSSLEKIQILDNPARRSKATDIVFDWWLYLYVLVSESKVMIITKTSILTAPSFLTTAMRSPIS